MSDLVTEPQPAPPRLVNIICMKWGVLYEAAYVNHLRNMVRRNLGLKHRFICFTDDPAGLDSGIEVKPLPEVHAATGPERFWNKLGIFSNPLADLTGQTLWLDLDVVIVNSIDCFFELPGKFCIIQEREFRKQAGLNNGNSSVCRFEAGAHADVLEKFNRDPGGVAARYMFDQEFISATIKPLTFWPGEWCRSFKKHCLARPPGCYFSAPKIPSGARIIAFHGHPKPADAARGGWVRGGIKYCRATPWIAEHWR